MADIVLSAGVRQNLLALQDTARLMSITQNRLATGKKVNSALDNPVNFFTSSGLQTRAGDLGALLDAMSNGVKTLQAADNGLTSITSMLQSMQSTLLQARQDKSYKSAGYGLGTINTAAVQNLSFSGGSVGTNPVLIALETNVGGTTTPPTAATITGGALTAMSFTNVAATAGKVTNNTFGAAMSFANVAATSPVLVGSGTTNGTAGTYAAINVSGAPGADTVTFSVNGTPITLDNTADTSTDGSISIAEAQVAIQAQLTSASSTVSVAVGTGPNAGKLVFTNSTTGYASTVQVTGIGATGLANATDLGFVSGDIANGGDAVTPVITFQVAVDGGTPQTLTINRAAVLAVGNTDESLDSLAELQAIVDAQLGSNVTVGNDGAGKLTLTSSTTGTGSSIAVTSYALTGVTANPAVPFTDTTGILQANTTNSGTNAVTPTLTFNVAIDGSSPQSVVINQAAVAAVGNFDNIIDTAAELAAIVDNQLGNNVTVDTNGGVRLTSATTGAGSAIAITSVTATGVTNTSGIANTSATGSPAIITGGTNTVKTVDQIVNDINNNASLKLRVTAANDGGKIRIQNLSTSDLTLTGIDANGDIDGSGGTSVIGGNTVRANLVTQFNELRDQLDKLARDAHFNGVNLLAGDLLKVVFNETGTSLLDIRAQDSAGSPFVFNATNLGIGNLPVGSFDFDSAIDSSLDKVSQALNVTRSQASNFGSSLSIVQNRQDFTKAMINTLQTGADNLTLADTNEEGANLLALQTRQQLSTTALSLAAQADQAVLRLFS